MSMRLCSSLLKNIASFLLFELQKKKGLIKVMKRFRRDTPLKVISELTGLLSDSWGRASSSDQLILPMENCILAFGMQEMDFLLNQKNN